MDRMELLTAVAQTKPAITTSTLVEQNNVIIFTGREVQSYNDEILISVPIKTDLKGAIPAREMIDLLMKMEDEKIKVSQKNGVAEIKGKTTKAKITVMNDTFPKMEEVKKWKKLPADFLDGLNLCRFSTGDAGDVFNNVCIKGDKIISCDNYRMTQYTMDSDMVDCLIPSQVVAGLLSFMPTSYATNKSWLCFRDKFKASFFIRRVKEKFPDVGDALKVKAKGEKIVLPDELKENLQRTEILADEDLVTGYRTVTVTIKEGKIVCHGECEVGSIDETIKFDYDGKGVQFTIVPAFLCDILGKTNYMTVGDTSLNFKSKNFQHVVQIEK